ncbi:hypothetical protein EJB05_55748, partial [Eragrostis curvula]
MPFAGAALSLSSFMGTPAAASFPPSARGFLAGFGRSPQAAPRGHGTVTLAGQRYGTGSGGSRFGLAALKGSILFRDVKVACAYSTVEQGEWEIDFEALKDVERVYKALGYPLEPPASLPEHEKMKNKKLGELAEQSVHVLADSFARLTPESRRPLYPVRKARKLAASSPLSDLEAPFWSVKTGSVNDDKAVEQIDIEKLKDLDEISNALGFLNLPPVFLSEEETAMQKKLQAIAQRSIGLMADALTILPPAYRLLGSLVYTSMMAMHPSVARVALCAKAGRAKRGMAVTLAIQLDDFRRLLYALHNVPLPPTIDMHLVQVAATKDPEASSLSSQYLAYRFMIQYAAFTME